MAPREAETSAADSELHSKVDSDNRDNRPITEGARERHNEGGEDRRGEGQRGRGREGAENEAAREVQREEDRAENGCIP